MTPLHFTTAEIASWVGQFIWPFLRIGAMLVAAPLFGARSVSLPVRLLLALLLALAIAPQLPPAPAFDPLSAGSLFTGAQQILIGLVIGFALQMVFAALTIAGESVALSMGLGFAAMQDPVQGITVPVISQFFNIFAMLIFLALNGHLALIELTAQSFHSLPVGTSGIGTNGLWTLVSWGSDMFVGALLIALPAVAAMLLVNLAMGVISRAAPQLNIFAVGFPAAILTGVALILIGLPALIPAVTELLDGAFTLIVTLTGG